MSETENGDYWERRVKLVSKYFADMEALNTEYFKNPNLDNPTREYAIGKEKCALCNEQATTKLHEALFKDEIRHELNNYYCGKCFIAIMTPAGENAWLRKLVMEKNYQDRMKQHFGETKGFGFQVRD